MIYCGGGELPPPFFCYLCAPVGFWRLYFEAVWKLLVSISDTMHKIREILKIGIPIMLGQACVIILAFADNIILTLAMIHPTCLHLCTKLLSKARKGDAIHPEKSALFTIY